MASALPNHCSRQDLYLSPVCNIYIYFSPSPDQLFSSVPPLISLLKNPGDEGTESKLISDYHMLFATWLDVQSNEKIGIYMGGALVRNKIRQ